MMRAAWCLAVVLCAAAGVVLTAGASHAQTGAIPQTAVPAPGTGLPMSEAAIDSACAARALPLAGAAIFGGLRETIARARLRAGGPPLSPTAATVRSVSITAGWYAILLFIGLAVLLFAGSRLRQVSDMLEQSTLSSLVTGVIADLVAIPVLLAAVLLLAITILGILLIPFAVVAIVLAYAGLAVLGLLAVASVTGRALLGARRQSMTERAAALAGLVTGLTVLLAIWFIAALFVWSPAVGLVLRSMAIGVTVVVVTAGAGAVIRSFRAPATETEVLAEPAGEDDLGWQTPTPVGGVVAVRRAAG